MYKGYVVNFVERMKMAQFTHYELFVNEYKNISQHLVHTCNDFDLAKRMANEYMQDNDHASKAGMEIQKVVTIRNVEYSLSPLTPSTN